jgi:hypothetical protein
LNSHNTFSCGQPLWISHFALSSTFRSFLSLNGRTNRTDRNDRAQK